MEPGKKYKLTFKVENKIVYYTAKILKVERGFVTFIDKYNNEICYNLNNLVSSAGLRK